jgi:PRTRC genetic system protein B
MIDFHTPSDLDVGAVSILPRIALIISAVSGATKLAGGEGYSHQRVSRVIAEHKLYSQPNGQMALGSGALVGVDRLADIVDELSGKVRPRMTPTLLPPSVLAYGEDFMAWHVPSAVRPMLFRIKGCADETLNVAWPSLLLIAGQRGLFLAALDQNERPDADTPVYHAPIMNHTRGLNQQ